MHDRFSRFLRRFNGATQGGILILTGIGILILMAVGGAAIDFGVQQVMRVKLQSASDAAATSAAGLRAPNTAVTDPQRYNAALRYFNLNYPNQFFGTPRPLPTIGISPITVSVGGSGLLNTMFISNLGISQLAANALSVVGITASDLSDFDLVFVIDESSSERTCLDGTVPTPPAQCAAGQSRIEAMGTALAQMINNLQPPSGSMNPNLRIGLIGYSRVITDRWGPSSNNSDNITALSLMANPATFNARNLWQNYDHVGMRAAATMMQGGTGSVLSEQRYNAQIVPNIPLVRPGSNEVISDAMTTAMMMPTPRTIRTHASDSNGMSPTKYVIFVTDGAIMEEPSASHIGPDPRQDHAGQMLNPYWYYDPTVYGTCPGPNVAGPTNPRCLTALTNMCNLVKSAGGGNGVRLFVADFIQPLVPEQTNTLVNCASVNPVTGQPDFIFAPTPAVFSGWLQAITQQIQQIRIQQ